MNLIVGYRKMLGYTQSEMAKKMGISSQSYWQKEKGRVSFSDKEKIIFKKLLQSLFPSITIDEIFFN